MLALHHAAQAGKRRTCCPIASRLDCLVPRLALLVPRCVRKREDQLVLDEIAHRHLLPGEHAVRRIYRRRLRVDLGLRRREHQQLLGTHLVRQRSEAALAAQPPRGGHAAPHADERPLAGEDAPGTAVRLAALKAQSVRAAHRDALIIGSDQVATSAGRALGKPGDHASAARQLRSLSGKSADFHTAVALLAAATGRVQPPAVPCRVHFRPLDDARIENYLRREQPYDCAGSAKAEGLGIALIARIETDDPTSLIGLPLLALTEMLERAGMPVLG